MRAADGHLPAAGGRDEPLHGRALTRAPALVGLLALGCGAPVEESTSGRLRVLETWGWAGSNGRIAMSVVPEPGETRLLATAIPVDPTLDCYVRQLEVPGAGAVYDFSAELDSDRRRSNAGYVSDIATLNWPITPSDVPLVPGRSHQVQFGVATDALVPTPGWLRMAVVLAGDDGLPTRTLAVDLVLYGRIADDPALRDATDGAIERWRVLYETVGIDLAVTSRTLDGPVLPPPNAPEGGELWDRIAATGPLDAVHVVVAPDEGSSDRGVVGVSGDIPGPLVPSRRTGIRIVPERLCGVDGACGPADVRMFGEVMAHEVGHFLGLFHPVEQDWGRWDALSDTVECDALLPCEQALGTNVMFPYPVCTVDGCVPQTALTEQQGDVLTGWVGVQ
ncbi:MAG: hypothetical protein R3F61_07600 [Myxococcota bacterium]